MKVHLTLTTAELDTIEHALRVARLEFERDAKQLGEVPLAETFTGYAKRSREMLDKLHTYREKQGLSSY